MSENASITPNTTKPADLRRLLRFQIAGMERAIAEKEGALVTARGRVGYIERKIADFQRNLSILKKGLAELGDSDE